MVKRIIVTEEIPIEGIRMLKESGFEIVEVRKITHGELKERIGIFDVIIVRSKTKVDSEIIKAGKNLKIIARSGVGLDNIDTVAAQKHKIDVVNVPGAPSESVAELVFALILSLFRDIPKADKAMKEGKWIKKEILGKELKGNSIGIIGFGRIGQKIAVIAKAFEMNILCHDILESCLLKAREMEVEAFGPSKESLFELLKKSHIITLHVPLVPETYHLIGEKEIQMMKDGAYIINTARGAVIDEDALYKALKSGKLAGAGLDVYEREPPEGSPLVKLPNVVSTPHIGASTVEAQKATSVILAEKIIALLKKP
ncbi:MAG: hydroxyacid dehydrogenase [Candidatus Hodarchaeota archaeon]